MSNLETVICEFNPAKFLGISEEYFNKKGDLRYCNDKPLVLTRGTWDYYTPHKSWIRYGLDIERYGTDKNWIGDKGESGEWAAAFHGLRRDPINSAKGIIQNGLQMYKGKNSQWGSTSPDIGKNKYLFANPKCGAGIFLTPKIEHLTKNSEDAYFLQPIRYNNFFQIQVLFICRLRPSSIRVPACANGEYYMMSNSEHIRPYGLVVNFLPRAEGEEIRSRKKFEILSPVELY